MTRLGLASFYICLFGWTFAARAQVAQEIHPFFEGSRALQMGGAQVAVVDDETALLANPAALGKLRNVFGTLIDPDVDVGTTAYQMYQNSSFTSPFDPSQVVTAAETAKGSYYHARAQVFPSLVVRNFGIGVFGKQELDMFTTTSGSTVNTWYVQDVAFVMGYNIRFFDGRIKIGVTGKGIDRIQINNSTMPYPGTFTVAANASEGAGVGADGGLILAGPWTWIPTLAVVARNIGGLPFTSGKNLLLTTTTTPTALTQDYDVGIAVFPIHGNHTRSSLTAEVQQVQAMSTATDKTRYYHLGWELDFSDVFFIRAGACGHGVSGGIELASEHTQLMLGTYGEDVGSGTTTQVDQRYLLKFAFRF